MLCASHVRHPQAKAESVAQELPAAERALLPVPDRFRAAIAETKERIAEKEKRLGVVPVSTKQGRLVSATLLCSRALQS